MKKILVFTLSLCLILCVSACSCNHEKSSKATCNEPGKCLDCGTVLSEPTKHHIWEDATCATPKKCSVCGKTKGKKLEEHTWVDADCENPRHCETCELTDGEAPGHSWIDATYESPKTCTVCGETEGEPKVKPPFLVNLKNTVPHTYSTVFSSGRISESVRITEVEATYDRKSYNDSYNIVLYFSGEKTYDEDGPYHSDECSVGVKVYDTDGYVVADTTYLTKSLKVGEKFKRDKCVIYDYLPQGEYTVVFSNITY